MKLSPNHSKPKTTNFILKYIKGFGVSILLLMLLEAGQAACQILLPKAIQAIIDTAIASQGKFLNQSQLIDFLKNPIIFFGMLNLGILLFSRISGAFMAYLDPALRRSTQKRLYEYLQKHSHQYFLNNFSGSLANKLTETAVSLNYTLWILLFDFWPITLTFTISMALLAQVHSGLMLFLTAWILLYIFISFYLGKKCHDYAEKFASERSMVTGKVVDGITNMTNTKLFANQKYERNYLDKYLNKEVNASRKNHWFMEKIRWFNFVAAFILQISMLLYSIKLWSAGQITIGQLSMATTLTLLIINEAQNLSKRFMEYFEYLGNVSDGINTLLLPHEMIDKDSQYQLKIKHGKIEFKNVSFIYSKRNTVFQNLNLTIYPGQKIALVGESGSGKTTFVNLILRLYDIQSGSILIDSQDINHVAEDSLRSQIAIMPQDPMLFHRSILENIRYGKLAATDEEVYAAAKRAKAHDFIQNLSDGYETIVGERGVKLSGGQRQRIVIARAILKDAPILIMDEATASLDSETENYIQNSLEETFINKTVFVIAHRLSTITNVDRILVFKNGQIVEDGHHHSLIAQDGYYAQLWAMQTKGASFISTLPTTESNMII